MRNRRRQEESDQTVLAQWLDLTGLLWCHVPNGGHRDVRVAVALKRQGVKRGVPDVLIFDPTLDGRVGLAIELKSDNGRVTVYQDRWLHSLYASGWGVYVCVGVDDAMRRVRESYAVRV